MIDLTKTFVELDDSPVYKKRPVSDPAGKVLDPGEPLTMKDVCLNALCHLKIVPLGGGNFQHEVLPLKESMTRADLIDKIKAQTTEVDLTSDERVLIKNKLPDLYSPIVVGPAAKILN